MSDYIKREDAEKAILDCPVSGMLDLINLQTAITNIDTIPSADVVEVVRCKDCIYNDRGWCGAQEYGTHHVEDNDYCSYGERKEQKHE